MATGYAKRRAMEKAKAALDTEEVTAAAAGDEGARLETFFVAVHVAVHAALDAKDATGDTILEKIASLSEPA